MSVADAFAKAREATTSIGAFVLKDGDVRWRPPIDINKISIGGQIVGVVALLGLRSVLNARRRG